MSVPCQPFGWGSIALARKHEELSLRNETLKVFIQSCDNETLIKRRTELCLSCK